MGVNSLVGMPNEQTLFLFDNGSLVPIANNTPGQTGFGGPDLNDAGVIAYEFNRPGTSQLIIADDGPPQVIVDVSGFGSLEFVAINSIGDVAFEVALNDDARGIFAGPDLLADKVIATGDALFGSTVESVRFFRDGLNDANQIAFWASLADVALDVSKPATRPSTPETKPSQPHKSVAYCPSCKEPCVAGTRICPSCGAAF